ncbi:hypothetical protein LXL04_035548 [Taraxacum kok-saghyz]
MVTGNSIAGFDFWIGFKWLRSFILLHFYGSFSINRKSKNHKGKKNSVMKIFFYLSVHAIDARPIQGNRYSMMPDFRDYLHESSAISECFTIFSKIEAEHGFKDYQKSKTTVYEPNNETIQHPTQDRERATVKEGRDLLSSSSPSRDSFKEPATCNRSRRTSAAIGADEQEADVDIEPIASFPAVAASLPGAASLPRLSLHSRRARRHRHSRSPSKTSASGSSNRNTFRLQPFIPSIPKSRNTLVVLWNRLYCGMFSVLSFDEQGVAGLSGCNPGNIRVCSGPDFLPAHPTSEDTLDIYKNYRGLSEFGNWFQLNCSFLRFILANLSKPGQPARLSRFGQFRGQTSQNLKDKKDRPHDTLTTVKILASNSKVSGRYASRKTVNEQRNYRLLRSRTEMAVIPKPELQTINRRMFWNRHTWDYISRL